jgi:hypothetical protein
VLNPTKATERSTITEVNTRNAGQSSTPARPAEAARGAEARPSSGTLTAIPSNAGTISTGAPDSPQTASTGVAITGASANPTLPPRENQLIRTGSPPVTERASRAPSGWYAATPTPDSAIAVRDNQ